MLPGFGLTLGFATFFLSAIVLLPLAALVLKTASMSWADFVSVVLSPRALASYRLSFGASLVAALINTVFGFIVAWTLVRYDFPGRKILDAMIDMPFALPTAVSGIALTAVFAQNGWIGQYLEPYGIKVAYTWIGRHDRADADRTALRRPLGPAVAPRGAAGPGGRRRDPGRDAVLHLPPHHLSDRAAGARVRVHAGLRPRRRRVRLGDLHRRATSR